jgi:hypothetical protein
LAGPVLIAGRKPAALLTSPVKLVIIVLGDCAFVCNSPFPLAFFTLTDYIRRGTMKKTLTVLAVVTLAVVAATLISSPAEAWWGGWGGGPWGYGGGWGGGPWGYGGWGGPWGGWGGGYGGWW